MTTPHSQQLIETTKKLVKIESTANNPKGLLEALSVITQILRDSGKNITIEHFEKDGIASILAYKGDKRPHNFRVILNGHLDVVPGRASQYQPVIKDGKFYGRGVYDMKAAAVIMTDIFCEFVDKVPYALGLQIVTDEENSGRRGTMYQVASGVRGDFIICGECGRSTTAYEIANECKGMLIADIEFNGTAAHGAYLWRGENAILRATKFVDELTKRYPVPDTEVHCSTINVSHISSRNDADTKVPDHATVKLDIRFTPDDPNFRSPQHFAALVEEIDPNARISNIKTFDGPIYTNPKNPLLLSLKAAAEDTEKHEFKLARRHATSDGRFYGNVGDQACEFGIAGEGQHGDNEYITLDAFYNYHRTLHKFLTKTIITEAQNANTVAYTAD